MNQSNQAVVDREQLDRLKRKALNGYNRVLSTRNAIAELACLSTYNEEDFDEILRVDSEEDDIAEIVEVLKDRFTAAEKLEAALSRKSNLVRLSKEKGKKLSERQKKALMSASEDVSKLSAELSELPDPGCTREEWAEYGTRAVGHPTRAPEQDLIRNKILVDDSLSELNKMEKEAGLPRSVIKSLLEEQESFTRNGGRKSLPSSVAEVERLDTEYRRISGLYKQDEAKPDDAFKPSSTGRKPKSKEERLADYATRLESLLEEIQRKEALLRGPDYLERQKKIVERSRRYAKSEGNTSEYEELSDKFSKLKSLEKRIQQYVSKGSMSENEIHDYVVKAVNSILGVTADIPVKPSNKVDIDNAKSTASTKESNKGNVDIEDLMDSVLSSL